MKRNLLLLSTYVSILIFSVLSFSSSAQIFIDNICACDDGDGNVALTVTFGNWPTDPSNTYDVGINYSQMGGGTGTASAAGINGDPSGFSQVSFPTVTDAADPGEVSLQSVVQNPGNVGQSVDFSDVPYTISGPIVITSCPADQDVDTDPGVCSGTIPDLTSSVVVDGNCGVVTVTQSPLAGEMFGSACGDQVTVTITASDDGCAVDTTCEVVLTLVDNELPELVNSGSDRSSLNITGVNECLSEAASFDGATLESNVAALYTDNCGTPTATLTSSDASITSTDCSWEYTYTYTIEDGCGNSTTCEVVRSGSDQTEPVLTGTPVPDENFPNTCIDDAPSPLASDVAAAYTDNCGQPVTATLDFTNESPGCNWEIEYGYIVSDECGNTLRTEVIYTGSDDEAPSLIDPTADCSSLDITNVNECLSEAQSFDPATLDSSVDALYEDNCTGNAVSAIVTNTTAGPSNSDCAWSFTYEFTLNDGCGNTMTCEVTRSGGDTEAPSLVGTLPGGDEGNTCLANAPAAPAESLIANQYTDNCGVVTATLDATDTDGDDCSWTVTYTYIVEDECANTTTAQVEYTGGDTEDLTLTGTLPAGGVQGNVCLADAPAAPAGSVIAAEYTDNCGAVSATLDDTNTSGTDCSWTITYTYIVEDECNNTTTAQVEYTGGDTEAPSLVDPTIDCSSLNITDVNECLSDAALYDPAVLEGDVENLYDDNCGTVTATVVDFVGDAANTDCSWSFTAEFTIEDECGNIVSCEVTRSGGDSTPGELFGEPFDIIEEGCDLSALPAPRTTIAGLISDGFNYDSDNCTDDADVTITSVDNVINPECPIGGERVYTVTDECGNSDSNFQIFTIFPPDITFTHADTTVVSCADQADVDIAYNNWLNNFEVSGGCNAVVTNDASGTPDACGDVVTVTFTAEGDCQTEEITQTFTVTAPDDVVITCPGDQMEASCQDQADINAAFDTWIANVSATGGCDVDVTNDWVPGNYPDACGGAVTVEFTAEDNICGDIDVCSATFTVESSALAISCPGDVTETSCQDQADVEAAFDSWIAGVSATGGCDVDITNDWVSGNYPD